MRKVLIVSLTVVFAALLLVGLGTSQEPAYPDNWIMLGENAALVISSVDQGIVRGQLRIRQEQAWVPVEIVSPTWGQYELLDPAD